MRWSGLAGVKSTQSIPFNADAFTGFSLPHSRVCPRAQERGWPGTEIAEVWGMSPIPSFLLVAEQVTRGGGERILRNRLSRIARSLQQSRDTHTPCPSFPFLANYPLPMLLKYSSEPRDAAAAASSAPRSTTQEAELAFVDLKQFPAVEAAWRSASHSYSGLSRRTGIWLLRAIVNVTRTAR